MAETKDAHSNPPKLTSQQKTALTDETAKRIIDEEVLAREAKTERLREMRMEREANAPIVTSPGKPSPKKT